MIAGFKGLTLLKTTLSGFLFAHLFLDLLFALYYSPLLCTLYFCTLLVALPAAGFKGLTILKTTQSGFEGFLKDQYTLLPCTIERCMGTEMDAKWTYLPNTAGSAPLGRRRRQTD